MSCGGSQAPETDLTGAQTQARVGIPNPSQTFEYTKKLTLFFCGYLTHTHVDYTDRSGWVPSRTLKEKLPVAGTCKTGKGLRHLTASCTTPSCYVATMQCVTQKLLVIQVTCGWIL